MLAWIEAHPGTAAWVQAVGTIAAVAFAVALPVVQRRSAEQAAALAARTPLTNAMTVLTQATNYVRADSSDAETKHRIAEALNSAHQGLANFPIHSLSSKVAPLFQSIRDAFLMITVGFSDPKTQKLGFFYLRAAFLHAVQNAVPHGPQMLTEHMAKGLRRALAEAHADIAAMEAKGEKPDKHGL